jgi:hypothetical protein
VNITFRFILENGTEKVFPLNIDDNSLQFIAPEIAAPEWTKKEKIACPVENNLCPGFCPIAWNLDATIKFFDGLPSYEKVTVYVETEQRTYSKNTSLQDGIGSLIGILMTTSGCHVLDKLRPMVRYHLPFATLEETEYRAFSMFLLAQFLRKKKGLEPDWDMTSLKELYRDIMKINKNIAKRIGDLEKLDASINAVVILNNFANMVSFDLEDDEFTKFESLFEAWLK